MTKRNKFRVCFLGVISVFILSSLATAGEIHEAFYNKRSDLIKKIVENKPEALNELDKDGLSILHLAVITNHDKLVKFLLSKGGNVNIPDNFGRTPLHTVFLYRLIDTNMISLLLEKGAKINAVDDLEKTPLHYCVRLCDEKHIVFLIKKGASIDKADSEGDTALHQAIVADPKYSMPIISLLIKLGASLDLENKKGETPLLLAVKKDHPEAIKKLLEAGADPNKQNRLGDSAISLVNSTEDIHLKKLFKEIIVPNDEIIQACNQNMTVIAKAVEMYNMDHYKNEKTSIEDKDFRAGGIFVEKQYLKTPLLNPAPGCFYSSEGDLTANGVIKCAVHGKRK